MRGGCPRHFIFISHSILCIFIIIIVIIINIANLLIFLCIYLHFTLNSLHFSAYFLKAWDSIISNMTFPCIQGCHDLEFFSTAIKGTLLLIQKFWIYLLRRVLSIPENPLQALIINLKTINKENDKRQKTKSESDLAGKLVALLLLPLTSPHSGTALNCSDPLPPGLQLVVHGISPRLPPTTSTQMSENRIFESQHPSLLLPPSPPRAPPSQVFVLTSCFLHWQQLLFL